MGREETYYLKECWNVTDCPIAEKIFHNVNYINSTVYNLFGLNPTNFSNADKILEEKNYSMYENR